MMRLDARPEAIVIDAAKMALIVVDMQHAFLSPGGLLDRAGIDIEAAPRTIAAAQRVLTAVRGLGMPVVHLQVGYPPDLSTAGGPTSPNPRKELALRLMEQHPELRGELLIWGTWDAEIVKEAAPRPEEVVIRKSRYSGFAGTPLDQLLRSRNIQYLLFIGVATNVCVESTIRDAYFHEYWPILIADAAMQAGPRAMHEATLFNVEHFFGWVTTTDALEQACEGVESLVSKTNIAG
jgi:ureidoacrylate peracid hydrolase